MADQLTALSVKVDQVLSRMCQVEANGTAGRHLENGERAQFSQPIPIGHLSSGEAPIMMNGGGPMRSTDSLAPLDQLEALVRGHGQLAGRLEHFIKELKKRDGGEFEGKKRRFSGGEDWGRYLAVGTTGLAVGFIIGLAFASKRS